VNSTSILRVEEMKPDFFRGDGCVELNRYVDQPEGDRAAPYGPGHEEIVGAARRQATVALFAFLVAAARLLDRRLIEVELLGEHLAEHVVDGSTQVELVELLALELFERTINPRKTLPHDSCLLPPSFPTRFSYI